VTIFLIELSDILKGWLHLHVVVSVIMANNKNTIQWDSNQHRLYITSVERRTTLTQILKQFVNLNTSRRVPGWPTFLQARESVRYAISTILRVFLMDQAVAAAVVQQRGVEVMFALHPEDLNLDTYYSVLVFFKPIVLVFHEIGFSSSFLRSYL